MYKVNLRILLAGLPQEAVAVMEAEPARERFYQDFLSEPKLSRELLGKKADIVIFTEAALPEGTTIHTVCEQAGEALCILLTDSPAQLSDEELSCLAEVWPLTLTEGLLRFQFGHFLDRLKQRKDAWLCHNYWQTTINMSPDLIWYKDRIGAHLEVNDAFCEVVAKDKEDIRGRGHYYIWGLTKEQYEQGEFICNETEEAVMKAGHSMVFDEQVLSKHNGMRQLKTYKSPVFDEDGTIIGTVGVAMDVTREREYQKRILALARHDVLTGLPNRRYFYDFVEEHRDEPKQMLILDIDNYKGFNDCFGHQAGDEVLVMFAQVMRDVFKHGFTSRFGGDEFTVLYVGDNSLDKIAAAAMEFQQQLRARSRAMQTGVISASIGISFDKQGTVPIDMLIKRSDEALYEVKRRGKGSFFIWEPPKQDTE